MKKFLIIAALLASTPALAGTISITWTDQIVAAYQQGANASINGNATRAQVLLYWITTVLVQPTQAAVQQANTTPPVVPAQISIQ